MNAIPEDNLKYPVLIKYKNNPIATGFFGRKDNVVYFVTAKHVFYQKNKEGVDTLMNESAELVAYSRESGFNNQIKISVMLNLLANEKNLRIHPTSDVLVIKIGEIIKSDEGSAITFTQGAKILTAGKQEIVTANFDDTIKLYNDVSISNDIYIFGYPSSLGIKNVPQIDYERPLLRKGIVAGKNENLKTIILDCPSYYGNSGGPVVEIERVNLTTYKFSVVGLVSEFVPFEEEWYSQKHKIVNINIENSGYSVATPIDPALEVIASWRQS